MIRNLNNITPKAIETFLLETGWIKDIGFPTSKSMVFHHIDAANFQVAIPVTNKINDYGLMVLNLVLLLSELSNSSPDEIIDVLLALTH